MIIHLNGWPGVGKQTIGRIVASRLDARFIHNHLLHAVAINCTGLRDPGRWELYEEVRRAAYASLAKRPPSEVLVMTNALCTNTPRERDAWDHVVDLAMARHAALVPIVLEADLEENARRIQSTERIGRALSDPAALRSMFATDTIQRPDVPERLVLNVASLSASDAAEAILQHVAKLSAGGGMLPAATDKHRRFDPKPTADHVSACIAPDQKRC